MKFTFYTILPAIAGVLLLSLSGCGKKGCTDPRANNYDMGATKYDGSCTYDPLVDNLVLKMQPMIGSNDLQVDAIHDDVDGNNVRVETFKVLISNIRLIAQDDSEVMLKDVALFDFDPTVNRTDIGLSVPPGDYKELRFWLGLSEEQNSSDPAAFDSNHPLSLTHGLFWDWASKYIWVKFDGRADTTGAATNYDHTFAFHCGMDDFYEEVTGLTGNITVPDVGTNTLQINLDVDKILGAALDPIHLRQEYSTHTMNNPVLAERFLHNATEAFTLE